MRQVARRSLLVGGSAVALAAATGGLGGCSSGSPSARPTPTDRPVPRQARLRGRVVVATLQNPPRAAQAALTKAYARRQPDVEVVWQGSEQAGHGAYAAWLGTVVAADDAPDIVTAAGTPSARGYVNLAEYRARTNPHTGRAWQDDYPFTRYGREDALGRCVGFATETARRVIVYNTDLFGTAKVADPPRTYDELVDVCAALHAAGLGALSSNAQPFESGWLPALYFDQFHADWVSIVRAQPGDWAYDPRLDGTFDAGPGASDLHRRYTFSPQRFFRGIRDGALRFDTAQVAAIVTALRKVFPAYTGDAIFAHADPYPAFLSAQAAMLLTDASVLPMLLADLAGASPERLASLGLPAQSVRSFGWETVDVPSMTGPLVTSPAVVSERPVGYDLAVLQKDARQTELVMDFLMFWVSRAGYAPFVQAVAPADSGSPRGALLVSDVRYAEDVEAAFAKVPPRGRLGSAYGSMWVRGGGPAEQGALGALFTRALRGELKPADYGKALQAYVSRHLAALMKPYGLTNADLDVPERRPAALAPELSDT